MNLNRPVLALTTSLLILAACSAGSVGPKPGESFDGKVMEQGTGKPIPGALVMVKWMAAGWEGRQCYHVEVALSNHDGVYHIPAWHTSIPYQNHYNENYDEMLIVGYKRNYAMYYPPHSDIGTKQALPIHMLPFTGSVQERIAQLKAIVSSYDCSVDESSERKLYKLYEPIYWEAQSLLSTAVSDSNTLQWFRDRAADVWVGVDPAANPVEMERRKQEFLKEHLK